MCLCLGLDFCPDAINAANYRTGSAAVSFWAGSDPYVPTTAYQFYKMDLAEAESKEHCVI